ncbi:hypothetical protein NFI96_023003 [Prochilodus magdalenae]|nr:hypothetical protein NFI96_023003 [Prochilodus magdalenae]
MCQSFCFCSDDFTAFGNSVGAPCVFPFFYNGTFYDDCISLDRPKPWCSTTDNYTRDEQWGECLDYDVCQKHMVLSDLWRNIGCDHYSFGKVEENDLYLQEGWYRFTGIGGDRLTDACSTYQDCSPENIFWPSILECDAGLTLYYLIPFRGMYMTCK